MSAIRHRERHLAVGVDAGGTWLRLLALDSGHRITRSLTLRNRDPDLGRFLRKLWRRYRWEGRVGGLVVAARGVWTARERRAAGRALGPLAARVDVLSDAQVALLGALADRPGVLLLSGTGSIAVGRDGDGRWARAGGLGPLLGDEGSAFWLGREWLRVTTRGEDFQAARRFVQAPDPVARIAGLAPRVLARARRGDRRARAIVRAAQAHLVALALDVARRLRLATPVDISWAGGVLADPWFRAGVARELKRAGAKGRWLEPAAPPVLAAARLAQRLARRALRTEPRRDSLRLASGALRLRLRVRLAASHPHLRPPTRVAGSRTPIQ